MDPPAPSPDSACSHRLMAAGGREGGKDVLPPGTGVGVSVRSGITQTALNLDSTACQLCDLGQVPSLL